jgi:hypothetical protein
MNEEYLRQVYDYIVSNDAGFEQDVVFEDFITEMGSQQYASQIYGYMGELDPSYKTDVSVIDFLDSIGTVKKKDKAQPSLDSPSEDGSLDSQKTKQDFQADISEVQVDENGKLKFDFSPSNVRGQDTRTTGYRDPITQLGMYPDQDRVDRAQAQRFADFSVTGKNAEKESENLKFSQAQAAQRAAEKAALEKANRKDVVKSQEFIDALDSTTAEAIGLEEDDGVAYFNNLYAKYGFTFVKTGFGDAMKMSTVLPNGEVVSETIDLDTFTNKGAVGESQKVKDFVTKYARKPEERREEVESNFMQSSLRAKNLRKTPRLNADGTESTVLFESANIDGKDVVYPTLFPKNPSIQTNNPDYWVELSGMEAYNEAVKRGELFVFEDAEKADDFAKGSWKEVRSADVEGDSFFGERGYDYLEMTRNFNDYETARDQVLFIEDLLDNPREFKDLSPEEQKSYKDLYGADGFMRGDLPDILEVTQNKVDNLYDFYEDDDLQEVREDYDVYIDKKYQKITKEAVMQNASVQYVENELLTKSLSEFGVTLDELNDYVPDDAEGVKLKDSILTTYKASKDLAQQAANTYEVAQTYLDSKYDENLRGEIVENWAGMSNEIEQGWYRGKAGNEILKLALGLKDIDSDSDTSDVASAIVDYMEAGDTGKISRAMGRWHQAKGFRESWNAFKDNPAELAVSMAGNSISQMLPYGWKIIGSSAATGTGIGAGIGATGFVSGPGGVVTTGAGALTGFSWGLRTGFSATGFALEYTNAIMDAARDNGYNIMNPEEMKMALQDETVWSEGGKRGTARGIPIAIVDMLSAGLAGRLFQVGKTTSFGRRALTGVGERIVFDPLAESTGEILAQLNAGEELDWKEVFAEGIGGLGNNAPFAALNMALDMRGQNNVTIANDLTTIQGINKELGFKMSVTPEKVSNWSNNMERLGQISTDVNQRIQKNLGLRQDALNVLNATEGGVNKEVLNRTMELMAAKNELESTANRKSVFSSKISEVKAELAELAETKKVRPTDKQTFLQIAGLGRQNTSTDIRSDVKASYNIDGKSITKSKFLKRIGDMSLSSFKKAKIQVDNDQDVAKIINDKFGTDAIQEQKTRGLFENKQTGNIQSVDTEIRNNEEAGGITTTQEAEVEVLEDNQYASTPFLLRSRPRSANERAEVYTGNKVETEELYIEKSIEKMKKEGKTSEEIFQKLIRRYGMNDSELRSFKKYIEGKLSGDIKTDIKTYRLGKERAKSQAQTNQEVVSETVTETEEVSLKTPTEEVVVDEAEVSDLEATLQESGVKLPKPKGLTPAKKKKRLAEIEAKIKEIRASKRNRATKAALIQELNAERTQIESGEVNFRLKEDLSTEGSGIVENIVEEMNAQNEAITVDIEAVEETNPDSPKIDVEELNSRTDNPIPTIEWKVIDGVPVIFNISDQLRTGDIVNPSTGNVIDNLKGGLGFPGVEGHQNIAWASIDEGSVKSQIARANRVYDNNKQFFDTWWSKNPEYNGLVPMVITKMESKSILSNEAVVRVLADNLESFPPEVKREALNLFMQTLAKQKESLITRIEKGVSEKTGKPLSKMTIRNYNKDISEISDIQAMVDNIEAATIADIVRPEALSQLKTLASVNKIVDAITYGKTNSPTLTKKPVPGKPGATSMVAKFLLGDNPSIEERSKLNKGAITDILTEPQLANTPQRSAYMVVGVDVLNPGLEKTTHPNYPVGPRGKVMGIIEQPQSIVELFPSAMNNVALGQEQELEGSRPKRTSKQRLSQTVPVQTGLSNLEFTGSKVGMDNAGRFMDFLNRSFPFVTISTDQQTMDRVLSSPFVTPYLKEGQVVYGLTQDGKIFINSEVHNTESELYNTAIHEMGHIWVENLKLSPQGKKIYAKGEALVKQTETYKKFLKKFDGDVTKAVDETMATLIGNKGESVVEAGLKQQIKDWIASVWSYVKNKFKLSKDLTVEEIQNLTMDEFLGTALADILGGAPVKITDKQLTTLTDNLANAMFRTDESIGDIVRVGRENGFSDASIKEVLKGRGYLVSQIKEAMTVQIDGAQNMPTEFSRVEGGVQKAAQLFNEINVALQDFSMKDGQRVKSFSEIREKAQELLKANPIFQAQPEQVQQELQIGFDRSLGYRGNKNVSQELANIRQSLSDKKVGRDNIKQVQLQLKNFIRTMLPKSDKYTQAQLNRLLTAVTKTTVDNFQAQKEKILSVVEQQRAKIKRDVIKDIYKIVKAKASPRKQSGKPRAKGIDAIGQVTFANIKEVLDAVSITNPELRQQALKDIQNKLDSNRVTINESSQKVLNNEELTLREESLLQLQLAYDQFGDLQESSLEVAQALLEDVKQQKKESILRFNNRRLQKAADAEAKRQQATEQIKETNPELFNEDGSLKNENELNEDRDAIEGDNSIGGLRKKITNAVVNSIFGRSTKDGKSPGLLTNFKNMLSHLGTITNFLDNKAKKITLFTDNVYRKLNRMEEVVLQNKRKMRYKIDDFAREVGFESFEDVEVAINRALGVNKLGSPNTITLDLITSKTGRKYKSKFSANQLLRLYALSKNPIQRAKLEKQGITSEVLADIETELGPQLTQFADKIVNYFSTEYFNETNAVYKQVNGVNLGFVENYFPTKTVAQKVDAKLLEDGDFNGIFSAETAPAFKERVDETSDINLKEGAFSEVMLNHIETMEKYKAMAVGVQQLNSFFNIPAVNTLIEVAGVKKLMKTLVNASIAPQSAAASDGIGAGFLERIQRLFTGFALSFKLVQIPKQATSFINAFEQYEYTKNSNLPRPIQSAIDMAMFAVDTVGVLFEMAPDLIGKEGAIAKARKMSAQFDQRMIEGLEGDVYGLESGSQTFKQAGKGTGLFKRFVDKFKRLSARPTIIGDIMGVMGYYANYKRNIANGMSEAAALEAFNDYNSTQQTRRATEKIPLQLRGDFASRGFTMFGSTLFLQINKVMQKATNISRSFKEGKMPNKEDIRGFYLNFAVANALFVGVSNLALLTRGDDEDRDAFYRKIKDAMLGLNLLYQLPYIGSEVEGLINKSRGIRRPVDDVTNPFRSAISKMNRNAKKYPDNWFMKNIVPVIELGLGAQVDPFIGFYNSLKTGIFKGTNQEEFYDNVYDFLGVTPSYRPQKKGEYEGVIPQGGIRTKQDLKRYDPELYELKYGERDRLRQEQKEMRKQMLKDMGYKEVGGKLFPID